jgi:dihydrofolate synthase/folylpolyglutamate synthase
LYSLLDIKYGHEYLEVDIANKATGEPAAYKLDLNGQYQAKNVLGVLTAVGVLQSKGWQISKQQILDGLSHVKKNTGLYGRWQIIGETPTTVVDVAHNVGGIQTLLEQIGAIQYNQLHFVMGMVKDKDIDSVLALLPDNASYYFTQAQIERALDATDLQQKAHVLGLNGGIFKTVNEAITAAKKVAQANDLIVVCGSVFLVGEIEGIIPSSIL